MNVKEVKRPISTVAFGDLKIGTIFYDKHYGIYCVKTGTFNWDDVEWNAVKLEDMSHQWYENEDEVIECQHQINVWY